MPNTRNLQWRRPTEERQPPAIARDVPSLDIEVPVHDPPLAPRDEAIFLLTTGAEIEHSLMVQYLYAAYSLWPSGPEVPPDKKELVEQWQRTLLGVAREEMGHLITVQNLLRLIGGPLTLEREPYPFRSDVYPFHFSLERLSKDSLAKYVVAEMPYHDQLSDELREIVWRATHSNDAPVNRQGATYARVYELFSPPPDDAPAGATSGHLADDDFVPGANAWQARFADWGAGDAVLMPDVTDRASALRAIQDIAEQGEGLNDPPKGAPAPSAEDPVLDAPSHFERFLDIYRQMPERDGWRPTYRVPTHPNTTPSEEAEDEAAHADLARGCITHPQSRRWAQLFNFRYRMLLNYLLHFLYLEGPMLDSQGHHTPCGWLKVWTFQEMAWQRQLAMQLATLPRRAVAEGEVESPARAGAPFELPYTLFLPDREVDRWRLHLNVIDASLALAHRLLADTPGTDMRATRLLQGLIGLDEARRAVVEPLAQGGQPVEPGGFQRVVEILDESVHGFRIGCHGNFWRGCTRDEFIRKKVYGQPLIAMTEDGRFDGGASNLVKALRGEAPFDGSGHAPAGCDATQPYPRMPVGRPPLPQAHIEFIRQWIDDGCSA